MSVVKNIRILLREERLKSFTRARSLLGSNRRRGLVLLGETGVARRAPAG
jgi:hypothetical protein